ncbi:MAG TPA: hypothetical protein VK679_15420 [Gemmatimonadaceae bacterium]|nr:hypothetical protein [Gemmatimonadaceae bacterium]
MLRLLDALADAIAARDLAHVWAIVNGPGSTALPQRVREEALSLAGLPPDSLRAPIALWQFRHQTCQLLCDESWGDPSQLELPLAMAATTA